MSHKGLLAFACGALVAVSALSIRASSRQAAPGRSSPAAGADAFETSIKPFLQTYCYGCHGGNQPAAGFDLTSYTTQDSVVGDQRRWNLVLDAAQGRGDAAQPVQAAADASPAAVGHRLD